jgi:hypothetical protein
MTWEFVWQLMVLTAWAAVLVIAIAGAFKKPGS